MSNTAKSKALIWWIIGVVVTAGAIYGLVLLASSGEPIATPSYPLDKAGANDWVAGDRAASVALIEYSDFQCPACGSYYPILKQVKEKYADRIAIVYRSYPLRSIHPNADVAARAAEAAGMQGKFWEMHDKLFEGQSAWSTLETPVDTFATYAAQIGLDVEKFNNEVGSNEAKDRVNQQVQSGDSAKLSGTPTFFLAGKKLQQPQSLDDFSQLIDAALKNAPLTQNTTPEKVHNHSDVRIIVEGNPIDLSQEKYQKNADGKELDEDVHFHDGNGEVVHVHAAGVTVEQFLTSLGMALDKDCLTVDASTTKCATGANKVRFYVNGSENSEYGAYVLKDLDRILITYGSENETVLRQQVSGVTDKACIYSLKCPERGSPPPEECAGGLGTDCD